MLGIRHRAHHTLSKCSTVNYIQKHFPTNKNLNGISPHCLYWPWPYFIGQGALDIVIFLPHPPTLSGLENCAMRSGRDGDGCGDGGGGYHAAAVTIVNLEFY